MHPEPGMNLEAQLRAYAERRRAELGEPVELHPATRRMLQAEVSSRRATRQRGWRAWILPLPALGPRLAYAAAIMVVVGVTTLAIRENLRPPPPGDIASSLEDAKLAPAPFTAPAVPEADKAKAARSTPTAPPAPATAAILSESDKPEALKRELAAGRRDAAPTDSLQLAKPPSAEGAVADPAPAPQRYSLASPTAKREDAAARARTEALAGADAFETRQAPKPQAPTANPAPTMADRSIPLQTAAVGGQSPNEAPVALTRSAPEVKRLPSATTASDEAQRSLSARYGVPIQAATPPAPVSQRFVQTPTTRSNDNRRAAAAPASLLYSFRLLQTNDQVTLAEEDGSVYSGRIRAATAPGAAAPARARDDSFAAQRWFFSASGVSRSLRQPVTVEGYFEPAAPAVVSQPAPTQTSFQALAPGRTQLGGPGGPAPPARAASEAVGTQSGALGTFPSLQNLRVTGQARVGATNVVPINAIPAGP